jgi:hypothetical protein
VKILTYILLSILFKETAMFNFKKNNDDDQQNQNLPDPKSATLNQNPTQNPTDNQTQADPNQPLTSPPNLDDFDPSTPTLDLPQTPASTPAPAPTPEASVPQPQANVPDLDSQLKNLDNNNLSSNNEENQGEDIMTGISNFQEDFNTKYDQLAEKIRQFLNKKIEEDKKVEMPKNETLDPAPIPQPNDKSAQMPQDLAQEEIDQRQEQQNSQKTPTENQDVKIEQKPSEIPVSPGGLK